MSLVVAALLVSSCCTFSKEEEQEGAPWRTLDLQALIDHAPHAGEVYVPYGRYRLKEGLKIRGRERITLTARTGTWIYVDDPHAHVISIEGSKDIQIRNLSLQHWEPLEVYECHGSVVHIQNSERVFIYNSVLDGCGAVGVYAQDSQEVQVTHCLIRNNSFNALYLARLKGVQLFSNVIHDNGNFMQAYDVEDIEMRENEVRDNFGYWARRSDTPPGPMERAPVPLVYQLNEEITAADRYRMHGEYKDLKEVVEARFVKGKTTREDVRRWLGKGGDNGAEVGGQPGANYVYPGVGTHRWVYFSRREEPYGSILLVDFDQNDRVSEVTWVSE